MDSLLTPCSPQAGGGEFKGFAHCRRPFSFRLVVPFIGFSKELLAPFLVNGRCLGVIFSMFLRSWRYLGASNTNVKFTGCASAAERRLDI